MTGKTTNMVNSVIMITCADNNKTIGKARLKQLKRSQKAGKGLLPQWQVKNWKETYKIK